MTEMSPELKKRVATGLAGGLAFLLVLIFGTWVGVMFLTVGLVAGMVNEFARVIYALPDQTEKRYGLLTLAWLSTLINGFVPRAEGEVFLLGSFVLSGAFLFSAARHEGPDFTQHFKEFMASIFGLVYLVLLPVYLMRIHSSPNGVQWVILFFLIIWAGDTGAYFGGKKYGKRKLYPEVSPNKTVEGSAIGWASGVVISVLYKLLIFRAASWGGILVIPIVVGPVAQVGDLVESFLKRAFGVKDSGSILPGHGGFLDRFDSVIFGLPVMYACLRIFS